MALKEFFTTTWRAACLTAPMTAPFSPWAVIASLPFAPEIVLPDVARLTRSSLRGDHPYGFSSSYNPTFRDSNPGEHGWVSPYHYGINQGPIVAMIENYRSGLVWNSMRQCRPLLTGLQRAGFHGGWLADK